MTLLFTAFSLVTGSGKAVSVCGVNSALVARPSAGASRWGIAGYLVGIGAGALLLSVVVIAAGLLVFGVVPMGLADRRLACGVALIAIGALEARFGAPLLPHVEWAVPQAWSRALRADPFLVLFGFIRGIAVFNHSPFASMHAWILVLFLLPEATSLIAIATALGLGLLAWSLTVAALRVFDPTRKDERLLDLTGRALAATRELGRIDGVAIVAVGAALLISTS
jgi:hypothetical protein